MPGGFRFWTHGVAVIPEFTKEYTGQDLGLYMRRAGWGAQIRQKKGTSNWFHFAIPSATELDDENVSYHHAWLRFNVKNGAVIKRIHVRENSKTCYSPLIWKDDNLNITGQCTEYSINLPNKQCRGPLVICVYVIFEDDRENEVIFTGAGAHFEKWPIGISGFP